eukprot:2377565-Pleurochrysis_carterae.AAC.3
MSSNIRVTQLKFTLASADYFSCGSCSKSSTLDRNRSRPDLKAFGHFRRNCYNDCPRRLGLRGQASGLACNCILYAVKGWRFKFEEPHVS